jgi:hypothetical protein
MVAGGADHVLRAERLAEGRCAAAELEQLRAVAREPVVASGQEAADRLPPRLAVRVAPLVRIGAAALHDRLSPILMNPVIRARVIVGRDELRAVTGQPLLPRRRRGQSTQDAEVGVEAALEPVADPLQLASVVDGVEQEQRSQPDGVTTGARVGDSARAAAAVARDDGPAQASEVDAGQSPEHLADEGVEVGDAELRQPAFPRRRGRALGQDRDQVATAALDLGLDPVEHLVAHGALGLGMVALRGLAVADVVAVEVHHHVEGRVAGEAARHHGDRATAPRWIAHRLGGVGVPRRARWPQGAQAPRGRGGSRPPTGGGRRD